MLLGEATHGTHEFYQARIELTQHLIEEKGFMAVMIEGDWPDAYRIHFFNGCALTMIKCPLRVKSSFMDSICIVLIHQCKPLFNI